MSVRGCVWRWLFGLVACEVVLDTAFGDTDIVDDGFRFVVFVVCLWLCAWAAVNDATERRTWAAFAGGLACWTTSLVTWRLTAVLDVETSYPATADFLWLLSYPLFGFGLGLLLRRELVAQPLERWLDGVAFVLVAAVPFAALELQPLADRPTASLVPTVFNYAFPVLDSLLVGATLGIFALRLWRPGRRWLLLSSACLLVAGGDAILAVQIQRGVPLDGDFNFVWSAAAIAIALAAWTPRTEPRVSREDVGALAVIALPLTAQVVAIGTQIFGLVHELGSVERLVTIVVLAISMAQLAAAQSASVDG